MFDTPTSRPRRVAIDPSGATMLASRGPPGSHICTRIAGAVTKRDWAAVRRLAASLGFGVEDAEDIAQDTMVAALARRGRFRSSTDDLGDGLAMRCALVHVCSEQARQSLQSALAVHSAGDRAERSTRGAYWLRVDPPSAGEIGAPRASAHAPVSARPRSTTPPSPAGNGARGATTVRSGRLGAQAESSGSWVRDSPPRRAFR